MRDKVMGSRQHFKTRLCPTWRRLRYPFRNVRAGILDMGDVKGVIDALVQRAFYVERKGRV
jgi:hypothetical protein